MYAEINLLEPMNCFRCYSRPDQDAGLDFEPFEVRSLGVQVLRLHDGRGGIPSFQTDDIQIFQKPITNVDQEYLYQSRRFPGYIPQERYEGREISLIRVCNDCETIWEGRLKVELNKTDDIYLTKSLDFWASEGIEDLIVKLARWQSRSGGLYDFSSAGDGKITITPNIEVAVNRYHQKFLEDSLKFQSAMDFLTAIRHEKVPTDEILAYLVDKLKCFEGVRVDYKIELAKAVVEYDIQERRARYSESALTAALIILHNYDRDNALELLSISGLDPKDFEARLKLTKWFFIEPKKLTDIDKLSRIVGMVGGPNCFLSHLYRKK